MARLQILIVGLILFFQVADAQNPLDSLFNELRNHPKEDSTHISILGNIALKYRYTNSSLSIKYFQKALRLAERKKDNQLLGILYNGLGEVYIQVGETKDAVSSYLTAAKILMEEKDYENYFRSLTSLTSLYLNLDNIDKAEEYWNQEAQWLSRIKNNDNLSAHYSVKASILLAKNLPDSVIYYYKKSLVYSLLDNNFESAQATYCNIGLYLSQLQQYDSAEYYIRLAIRTYPGTNFYTYNIASAYSFLADNYLGRGNLSKAKIMYDSSNLIATRCKSWVTVVENYLYMSDMYKQQKDYVNHSNYLELHYNLKDSLFGAERQNQLNQLEQKFTQELNEKEINSQKEEKRLFIALSLILLTLAGIIFYFGYKTRQKNNLLIQKNREIELQKEEIETQRNELQKLNQTKDKLFQIIGHDLRNPLITLSEYLDATGAETEVTPALQTVKQRTTFALQQSISLLDNLLTWAYAQIRPTEVRKQRVETREWLDELESVMLPQASQKNIRIQSVVEPGSELWIGDQQMMSIVVRNLLTNAIKFSYSDSTIDLITTRQNNRVLLSIQDYGLGMSSEKIDAIRNRTIESTTGTQQEKGTGLGLGIVLDLLEKMEVPYEIISQPEKGTRFVLQLLAF
jgi:signal transduction histidine kinase/tetratricopeptide (TPR) repeat protein